jgi:hypothetical protein
MLTSAIRMHDDAPVFRLGPRGPEIRPGKSRVASLARAFRRDGHVRLPGLLSTDLIVSALARVRKTRFRASERSGVIDVEGSTEHSADYALNFLLQDEELFAFVSAVTGCGRVRAFSGRLIRSRGGTGHFLDWHQDAAFDAGRLASLSLNLSPRPYRGGLLQFRRPGETRVRAEVANTGLGDAVLFAARGGEHRNTPLEGRAMKTAFSGWFYGDRGGADDFFMRAAKKRPTSSR